MVDNVAITAGSGTTIAADDVGGVLSQRVKVQWGPDGTVNDADVASGKPLPIQVRSSGGTEVTFNANGSAASTNSAPVVIASDQATLSVAQDTSKIMNAATGTALTPTFAVISCSSSGANSIVSADATKKIRVLQWIVTVSGAVNFKWQSASTDKSGLFYMASAGSGAGGSFNPVGHFETVANEALNLNLSGATAVGGYIVYVKV